MVSRRAAALHRKNEIRELCMMKEENPCAISIKFATNMYVSETKKECAV